MCDEKSFDSDNYKSQPLNANSISPYEKCPFSKNMQWKENQISSLVIIMFRKILVIESVSISYCL